MSVNKACILGAVGQDPKISLLNDGKEVASFSIATSDKWKDKEGNKQERTEWHKIVVFGGVVNVVKNYVKKGSKLYIEGKIQTRNYEKDGVKHYVTEIVLQGFNSMLQLLDSKPIHIHSGNDSSESGCLDIGGKKWQQPQMSQEDNDALDGLADNIPF